MLIYEKKFDELTREEILKRQWDCKDMIRGGIFGQILGNTFFVIEHFFPMFLKN